ncbi:hypothetical protein JAAARDRAFT_41090 [Jaapia argillacea MUCL 33604]|uniref:Cytochrome P450 n=1 Tax=Jaapia argillacea MUCL 33604 TaxID=933084 RepID=A0A067PKC3_9AGAM|nr:hypothetical protein JAAARDRAFT_41090 [Jaapia argillacea MUCL 33604]
MDSLLVAGAFSAIVALYLAYRRSSRISLADVPGPEPESFLLGNLRQIFQGQAGEADFKWQEYYDSGAIRIKAPFGEDRLMVSDPKALQYIFQTNPRNFQQPPQDREILRTLLGPGIAWADAHVHMRHRKVMTPAFGIKETKALLPIFRGCVERLSVKWKELVTETSDQSIVLNVPKWLSRATLDVIGEAAFDYNFGALEKTESELGRAYENLMSDAFAAPTPLRIFIQGTMHLLPCRLIRYLLDNIPVSALGRLRSSRGVIDKVAKELVDRKKVEMSMGGSGKDVMSLLVRANASENASSKLSDEEMFAQMSTIMFAGHESTSTSLSWVFYELAKHPEVQSRMRAEIREWETTIRKRGDSEFSMTDYEGMGYTLAVIKEILRLHPIGYHMVRQPRTDDVLPLSKTLLTISGKLVNELPIPEGCKIIVSVAGYQRNMDVWGPNAHEFYPERWLKMGMPNEKNSSVGVVGNLMTFSAGLRSCMGWRIAMAEIQTFLIDFVSNFEFSLTDEAKRIRREACLVMVPMIEGEEEKGVQLPLRISLAARE